MKQPILTVAIATYNRKELLLRNVANILKYQGDNIEVVVTDDASTDGTVGHLRQKINDPRLSVVEHKTNMGAFNNFVDCLFNGNGKYVIYSNDRDFVLPESLPFLIEILKKGEYAYLYTENDKVKADGGLRTYEAGFDSLIHNPIACHPTGNVFNAELMKEHLRREDYFYYSKTVFPERFISRALCCYGQSGYFDYPMYHNGSAEMLKLKGAKGKSGAIPEGEDEKFYFHPKMSWLLFEETWVQVFDKLSLKYTIDQKVRYADYLFNFLIGRLPDYKRFRNNEDYIRHYDLASTKVSTMETLGWLKAYNNKMNVFLRGRDECKEIIALYNKQRIRYFAFVLRECLKID